MIELVDEGIEIEDTAFTIAEFDQITLDDEIEPAEQGPLTPASDTPTVARPGDVFVFDGGHRLVCGDATDPEVYGLLFGDGPARLVLTDEPYNVPIGGHVTKGNHREFAMASGEMSDAQFSAFNSAWMGASLAHLCDGGLIGTFIDWRGYPLVHAAATSHGLVPINLCVWTKTNGGMGSLYRSQHELFPLYKNGTGCARQQYRARQERPLALECVVLSRRFQRQLGQPQGPRASPDGKAGGHANGCHTRSDPSR